MTNGEPSADVPPSPVAVPPAATTLTYLTAGGDAPPPLTAANAHLLDQAAEYLAGMKTLRSSAMFDIVWGGLVLGLGLLMIGLFPSRGPIYAPIRTAPLAIALAFIALGTMLVGTGAWTFLKPNVTTMLIDGVVMLFLFLITVGFIFFDYEAGNHPEIVTAITPPLILFAAVSRLRSLRRFGQASRTPLTPATARWLRELQRGLSRAHLRDDPQLVTFAANAFPPLMFKGRLLDDVAVCLLNNNRLRFLTRDQFRALVLSEGPKWSKVRVTVDDRTLTARITPAELERLLLWQAPVAPE